MQNEKQPTQNDTATSDHKSEITKNLEMLRGMREEVRLKLHLAGMDARDEWNKLEPHLLDVEKAAEEWTEGARNAIVHAVDRLKRVRAAIVDPAPERSSDR